MSKYKLYHPTLEELRSGATKILDELYKKDISIDTLVPVLRGGMPLALLIGSNLEHVETSCIQIKRSLSNKTNSDFGEAEFKGITNENEIKGKNILILEDIVDKGETLEKAIKILKEYRPKNIYVATMYNFNKEYEKKKNFVSGKYLSSYVWIVFPWEEKIEL